MRRISLVVVALLAAAAGWWWWPRPAANVPSTPRLSGRPLTLGKYYWPGMFWVEVAERKGWFQEAGLDVRLVDTNPDYFKSLETCAEGRLDVTTFTMFDLVRLNAGGADLVGILVTDYSEGVDGLVAREGIDGLQGLKGRRVAVPRGTYLEYLLGAALESAGLGIEDVELVDSPAEQAAEVLRDGKADAVLSWEPFLVDAEHEGGRRLYDTSRNRGIAPCLLAFRRSLLVEREEDLRALIGVWVRATRFLRESPEEAHGIIVANYGKPLTEVVEFARRDRVPEDQEMRLAFGYSAGYESLHGLAHDMNEFMLERGMTSRHLDTTTLFDSSFVAALR